MDVSVLVGYSSSSTHGKTSLSASAPGVCRMTVVELSIFL